MTEGRDIDIDDMEPKQSKYKDSYDNSYAIVIGIDTYKNPRLRPLGKAEEDARNIAEVLSSEPYNFQVDLLLGEIATQRTITRALNKIIKTSNPNDRVIFYFAGHGYIQPDNRGIDSGYLAFADTDPEDPYDGLEYDEITKITRFAKAKHIAFILDACFSGTALGLTRSAMPEAAVREYLVHPAYQVLTAGAFEVVSDARSMTGELVKVLKDGIPGGQSQLTFNHLGQYIQDVIHNQSKGRQTPIYGLLEGSSKGQMVFRVDLLPDFHDLRQGLQYNNSITHRLANAKPEMLISDPNYGEIIRAKQFADSIKKILPGHFEWRDIPASRHLLPGIMWSFGVNTFKMAKYLVTYAQFQAFIDDPDGFRDKKWWKDFAKSETEPGEQNQKIDNYPRENVSWFDAMAFCRWLTNKVGYEVRLPTELEWQQVAEGPRYFGVHDMDGNLSEWCLSVDTSPNQENTKFRDTSGDTHQLILGGSRGFNEDKKNRKVPRDRAKSETRSNSIGFRVVGFPLE